VIMRIRFKTLLVLLSAALNIAFVGGWMTRSLRGGEPTGEVRPARGAPAGMPALYQRLGATEEQWQQLRPGFEAFRESALGVFTRISQRRQELLGLLADAKAERGRIAEKQKEIREAQGEMQDLVITHVMAERELLTGPQREKYFELLAQRCGMLCENLMDGLRPVTSGTDSRMGFPPGKQKE
jgi:Spy/CpxP family protein refolding chaperone